MPEPADIKTILVTGGAGFIGSNFIRYILETRPEWQVVNLDKLTYASNPEALESFRVSPRHTFVQADVADREYLEGLFSRYRFDAVVHFAAESHVDNSISAPADFIQTNLVGTFSLLEACRRHWLSDRADGGGRFLHISTDEVYGSLGESGKFSEDSPYRPNSPYSASKAGSDHLVRSYFHTYGMDVVITNCSNNYGPYQHAEKFIPTIIRKALAGQDIPVYGDGTNIRDWLYVEDHCEALLVCLEKGGAGEQYVIGGNNEWANLDLVRYICERLDTLAPRADGAPYYNQMRLVTDRPGHDRRYAVDAAKMHFHLGWSPRTAFQEGMDRTITWYLQKFKKA